MGIRICEVALVACALSACSHSDRDRARERRETVKQKAHQFARELRRDAREAEESARRALESGGVSGSTQSPEAKIRDGAQELRAAGSRAMQKADQAGTIAQAKTRLAQAVGISAITNVQVSLDGDTMILTGAVPSEQDKDQAGRAAAQIPGVSKVVNRLQIEP
jgi:hypothetical protein